MKQNISEQIGIQSIYAANFLHNSLWVFVNAQILCGVNRIDAIRNFMRYFNVTDLDENALCQVYYRKNEEYKKCSWGITQDAIGVMKMEDVYRKADEIYRKVESLKKIMDD